jgi:hypothetical protein
MAGSSSDGDIHALRSSDNDFADSARGLLIEGGRKVEWPENPDRAKNFFPMRKAPLMLCGALAPSPRSGAPLLKSAPSCAGLPARMRKHLESPGSPQQ